MPSLAWQVKSNAACLVDAGTGEGFAVGVYDTTSADHQCDIYIDQFPIPTGTGAATSLSCAVRTSPNPPFTGYTASWRRNADGSNQIDIYSWTAGTHGTALSTNLGAPTPTAGDKFSFWAAGNTLTVFINDVQKVSLTDSTNTTGTFCGIHEFRNTTTSEARIAKFAAFAKSAPPPPPPPPGGGGPGTRQAKLWPGPANCAFNVPFGDACPFDTDQIISGGDPVHSYRYGITIYGAGYAVADQVDIENHRATIENGNFEYEGYSRPGSTYFDDHIPDTDIDLRTYNLSYTGMGAAKFAHIFGTVRQFDMNEGVIRHALQMYLENGDLSLGWVWPALGQDGDAANTYQGGAFHIGDRLGIPWNVAKPALSPQGSMVWDALKVYGAIVTNRAGNTNIIVEALPGDGWAQALRSSGDMTARIFPQLRRAKRSTEDANGISSSAPGGGGTPRGPAAPGTFV